jgi:hypothetical protein
MSHTEFPWFASKVLTDEYGFAYVSIGPHKPRDDGAFEDNGFDEEEICHVSGINHDAEANAAVIIAMTNPGGELAALRDENARLKRALAILAKPTETP